MISHNAVPSTDVTTLDALPGADHKGQSPGARALRILLRNPLTLAGLFILFLVVVAALWPVQWLPHDPYTSNIRVRFLPPAWAEGGQAGYLLGTDALGRDNLSMIVHGARASLLVIGISALVSLVIGIISGLLAGFYRGWIDELVMRLADVQLAFPLLILIIAVVAILGPSLRNLIIVIGIAGWAPYARMVRASVLSAREMEYFLAARAAGASDWRIMFRHLLPNTITSVVVFTSFELARLLLLESSLSFLGLGIQPPTPSWGAMIADGRQHLFEAWWASAFPGLAIVILVMALNLLGDGLRDALDPLSYGR